MAPSKKPIDDPSRQRVNMACTYCRYRKIKCCGSARCANCIRRKRECVYVPVPDSSKVDKAARKAANLERKKFALALTSGGGSSNASTPSAAHSSSSPTSYEIGPIDMRTGLPVDLSSSTVGTGIKRKKSTSSAKKRSSTRGSGEVGMSDEDEDDEQEGDSNDSGSDYESSLTARSNRRRVSIASLLPIAASIDVGRGRHDTTISSSSYSSEPQPLTPGEAQMDWDRRPAHLACEQQQQAQSSSPFSPDSDAPSLPSPALLDSRPLSPDFSPLHSPTTLTPFFPSVALGSAHQVYSPDRRLAHLEQQQRFKTAVAREMQAQNIDSPARYHPSVETMRRPGLPRTTSNPLINSRTQYCPYAPSPPPSHQNRLYYPQSPAPHPGHLSRSSSSLGLIPSSHAPSRCVSVNGPVGRYSSPLQNAYPTQQQSPAGVPMHHYAPMGHRHSMSMGQVYPPNSYPDPSYSSSLPSSSHLYAYAPGYYRDVNPRPSSYYSRQQQHPHHAAHYTPHPAEPAYYDDGLLSPPPPIHQETAQLNSAPTSSLLTAPALYANGIALSPYDLSVSAELNALFGDFDQEQLHLDGPSSLLLDGDGDASEEGAEPSQEEQKDGDARRVGGMLGLVDQFDSEFAADVAGWQDEFTFAA